MAKAQEIMTGNPRSCAPHTPVTEIAKMMADEDCGLIPVTETGGQGKLVGVVTDRDIVVRVVAKGEDINDAQAKDCMSHNVKTATPEDSIEKISNLMETQQVRRIPIVDANGILIGIVSMADLALNSPENADAAIKQVSEPTG